MISHVLVIYYSVTQYHKLSSLKHIYYLMVSMGQESRHSPAEFFARGLKRLQSRCQLGCSLICRLDWGRICFQAWQNSCPSSYRTEGCSLLGVFGQRLPSASRPPSDTCHIGLPTWLFPSSNPVGETESLALVF